MTPPFRVEPFERRHEHGDFDCGTPVLDRYLREVASQDVRRRISTCYVACAAEEYLVSGFYTLAAAEVPLAALPNDMAKKLPRYPSVPVIRIGRLAVDRRSGGRGLGSALIADAAIRAGRAEIGAYGLVVDAKDDAAAAFYRHLGFAPVGSDRILAIPFATLQRSR